MTTSFVPRRRRRLVAGLVGAGLVALGAGAWLWLTASSTPHAVGHVDCTAAPVTGPVAPGGPEHRAVCATIGSLTTAWNAGDADAYGAAFTPDATYTSWVGTHYAGREDVVESHRALFGGLLSGTRLVDRYLSVRFVRPDVAVVSTRGDTYDGDEPPSVPGKVQTYIVVRDGGTWSVAAFHNTARRPVMERIQFLFEPASRPAAER
ncbi:SgcJ/EcaC family oxidoreductase [Pseudonocardia nematodicida]|uniref:SgcJ/EcaC family oxidoreductase n=1 Tax=Pseudonocardia nematodicida TaxID=1206997 RepID=A0ABV1KHB3_9PSEU